MLVTNGKVTKIGLVMELTKERYLGKDGKKNFRMDIKFLALFRYLCPSILLIISIASYSKYENLLLYVLINVAIIVSLILRYLIVKAVDNAKTYRIKIINMLLTLLFVTLILGVNYIFLISLVLLFEYGFVYVYTFDQARGTRISKVIDNPLINALPKIAIISSMIISPFSHFETSTTILLLLITDVLFSISLTEFYAEYSEEIVNFKKTGNFSIKDN